MNIYDKLLFSFTLDKQTRLLSLIDKYQMSRSDALEIFKAEADLELFSLPDIFSFLDFSLIDTKQAKRRKEELFRQLRKEMDIIKYSKTDYSSFFPPKIIRKKTTSTIITDDNITLLGKCPCPIDGEVTRCCKLTTLDAVSQCSFGCSYCSVQSFYSENKISIVSNLGERLKKLDLTGIWHIGTGQASDSLLLGNSFNTLTALNEFAKEHPEIIIELKTKSNRVDFLDQKFERNIVFTWSLNAPTICKKEEHLTASLENRIKAAKKIVEHGNLVGFHIHPMMYFTDYKEEYSYVVKLIEDNFSPQDIMMISMGTLTFTKSVLEHLRTNRTPSRVLSMPLVPAAGKFSYPNEIKEEMFSHVYSSFSSNFKDNIFFYLCMEDPSLWPKVLKREYSCDKDFELDMKKAYFSKV